MSLAQYHRKRDFRKTKEPPGVVRKTKGLGRFVVQKHAASHLHFDFRLELDGVLKSWAVPKGPSLDPGVKALAVEVEDHPLDYGDFEGTIPLGEYGGGTVMLWDRGTWQPTGDSRAVYDKGHLRFTLQGERLKGAWTLQRIKIERGRAQWLLIKRNDEAARPGDRHGVVERETTSIESGCSFDEIAARHREWVGGGNRKIKPKSRNSPTLKSRSNSAATTARKSTARRLKTSKRSGAPIDMPGAKRGRIAKDSSPQLATLAERVPDGDEWLHEMKFDGYRILAIKPDDRVRLVTRNGNDWTAKFPQLAAAIEALDFTGLLDGEVTAIDERGVTHFQKLQNAIKHGRQAELIYYAFDLLFVNGYDLRAVPLVARKRRLAELIEPLAKSGPLRFSEHVIGRGSEVLASACKHGLEGIVSKRSDSRYESARSRTWLKTKCHGRQEFVVAGYTDPNGTRIGFGALLLGYYDAEGELRYCGKVGTGFDDQVLRELKAAMDKLVVAEMPFVAVPRAIERSAPTWLRPKLVAEIEFTEWTADGALRHPSFQGLRKDKKAEAVVRETTIREELQRKPKEKERAEKPPPKTKSKRSATKTKADSRAASDEAAGVKFTHPDRVLYPDVGLTKRDLAGYYELVAEWILPHVIDRPITLVRCPGGEGAKCFFQKHWTETLPEQVGRVSVPMKSGKERYVALHDLAGLVGLVQMSVLELHPWGAKIDDLEHPDQIIFDLDPGPNVAWPAVVQGAQDLCALLDDLKLKSFVRTSGGKGLHLVVPIARRSTWDEAADFARNIAVGLATHEPRRFVANMRKELRKGKIFVDYLRNQRGSTSIASYSTRSRPGAPVAVPITWKELPKLAGPAEFNVRNVPERLRRLKHDPWEGFSAVRQSLTKRAIETAEAFARSRRSD